jgi:hypothetical protein
MFLRRCICGIAASLALVAATAAPASASASCARSYSYAGYDSPWYAHGVAATITVLTDPLVAAGHVAAWVGVGGVGAGLHGTDEWLQAGVAGFEPAAGTGNEIYYEVTLPHRDPVYHKVALVGTLKPVRLAVLEMAHRWGWWRIWMNGRPVTAPIFLPASHGVWQPEVTTESWNGGTGSCNHYSYKFDRVAISRGAGGAWMRLRRGHRYADPGYSVQGQSPRRFLASSSG